MNKDFTYQTIEIENIDLILLELKNYVLSHLPNNNVSFNDLNIRELTNLCPELFKWFYLNQMFVDQAAVIIVEQNCTTGAHIDYCVKNDNILALNFGIKIPKKSYTAIYTIINGSPTINTLPNGIKYITLEDANIEEISQFDLSKPVLFNRRIPHCVFNPSEGTRISVSFRFTQDPWHLIK